MYVQEFGISFQPGEGVEDVTDLFTTQVPATSKAPPVVTEDGAEVPAEDVAPQIDSVAEASVSPTIGRPWYRSPWPYVGVAAVVGVAVAIWVAKRRAAA